MTKGTVSRKPKIPLAISAENAPTAAFEVRIAKKPDWRFPAVGAEEVMVYLVRGERGGGQGLFERKPSYSVADG